MSTWQRVGQADLIDKDPEIRRNLQGISRGHGLLQDKQIDLCLSLNWSDSRETPTRARVFNLSIVDSPTWTLPQKIVEKRKKYQLIVESTVKQLLVSVVVRCARHQNVLWPYTVSKWLYRSRKRHCDRITPGKVCVISAIMIDASQGIGKYGLQ